MATVEQHIEQEILAHNGVVHSGEEIPVENPATGQIVGTRARPRRRGDRGRWPRAARAAQPEWEAYGFDGRARILLRARSG